MDEETREKLVHSLKAGMEIAKLAVFKDKSKQREDAYLLYQKSLRSFLTAIRVLQGKNNIDTFDSECDDGMMSSMRNRNDVQFQTERRMCQNRFSGCVFFFSHFLCQQHLFHINEPSHITCIHWTFRDSQI
jgi:hypothetical protein